MAAALLSLDAAGASISSDIELGVSLMERMRCFECIFNRVRPVIDGGEVSKPDALDLIPDGVLSHVGHARARKVFRPVDYVLQALMRARAPLSEQANVRRERYRQGCGRQHGAVRPLEERRLFCHGIHFAALLDEVSDWLRRPGHKDGGL